MEASNDGFWDWNIQTGEVYFSRRWAEMLGYKQEEIIPNVSSWEKLVHLDDMGHVMEVLKRHLSGELDHYETEHRVLCKNGQWKWILDRGRVITRSSDGTPLRAVGSHVDITEKKMIEEERQNNLKKEEESKKILLELNEKLKDALKTRSDFLAIASHELKTPLTSLILLVQAMKKYIGNGFNEIIREKIVKAIKQTETQLFRMTRLIDDMLDISRIESGKLTIKKEPFHLPELIHEIAQRLLPQIQTSSGSELKITRLDEATVCWDRLRIEQVITNYITNAIRYGQGSIIELCVEDQKDEVLISVKDYGSGIPKIDQTRIFNLFERGSGAKEVGGLGLGLFISKQIIEAHQGKVWVQSEVGEGSTFFALLPK
jgi:PAS domain S-box-containing protein